MADADEGTGATERTRLIQGISNRRESSLLRRSWHAMSDMVSPFSSGAIALLPAQPFGNGKKRSVRTDDIPDTGTSSGIRDYNSVNSNLPPAVRVPKKIPTPINVESKVWFANERSNYHLQYHSMLDSRI
jgi:hypothetical protein